MAKTPNMQLDLPVPGETPAGEWGEQVNEAFEAIDSHNHASGKGVRVPVAGIAWNADVPLAANSITQAGSIGFGDRASLLSTGRRLFVHNGDLYYTDSSSRSVRLTVDGEVASATEGAIDGLAPPAAVAYEGIDQRFTFFSNEGTGTRGIIDVGPVDVREPTSGAKRVRIKSPSALASDYDITLPTALPASTYPLCVSSAGQVSATAGQVSTAALADGAVTTAKLKDGAVTRTKLSPVGQQVSDSCGAFSADSTGFTPVTNMVVEITTSGRPIMVMAVADGSENYSEWQHPASAGSTGIRVGLTVDDGDNETVIARILLSATASTLAGWAPSTLSAVYVPPAAGTYTFKAQLASASGVANPAYARYMRLVAWEL